MLVCYDEAVYFECRGKDSGVVRFSLEILETLTRLEAEDQEDQEEHGDPQEE